MQPLKGNLSRTPFATPRKIDAGRSLTANDDLLL